ncbi:hypothetical protein AB834_04245 [PVC group bacterium (ex Bugula neritina AB1)]|nr:hypothetical protein AB834_04245 [PVC group bacterium (ex Bugula neritina AB1)]
MNHSDYYKKNLEKQVSRVGDILSIKDSIDQCLNKKDWIKNKRLRIKSVDHRADMTFESFVLDDSNEALVKMCHNTITKKSTLFDTVFIHGSSGVGKTHLLHAIYNEAQKHPSFFHRIILKKASDFTKHFSLSLKNRTIQNFRKFYRQANVLIIDNVHDLAHCEKTMEEFLHTFDYLKDKGSLLFFSSKMSPNDLEGFSTPLLNRFQGAVSLKFDFLSSQALIKMLHFKEKKYGLFLTQDSLKYISEYVKSHNKNLENVFEEISLKKNKDRKFVSNDLVLSVLKKEKSPKNKIKAIVSKVSDHYKVSQQEICSKSKKPHLTRPRYLAILMAYKEGASVRELGEYFGHRSFSSIHIALKMCQKLLKNESELFSIYNYLSKV